MPTKLITPEATAVKDRFVRAYEELRYLKLVKTKKEYCETVGVSNVSNLKRMETTEANEPSIAQLCLLIKKYHVSASWIMTGKGKIIE